MVADGISGVFFIRPGSACTGFQRHHHNKILVCVLFFISTTSITQNFQYDRAVASGSAQHTAPRRNEVEERRRGRRSVRLLGVECQQRYRSVLHLRQHIRFHLGRGNTQSLTQATKKKKKKKRTRKSQRIPSMRGDERSHHHLAQLCILSPQVVCV